MFYTRKHRKTLAKKVSVLTDDEMNHLLDCIDSFDTTIAVISQNLFKLFYSDSEIDLTQEDVLAFCKISNDFGNINEPIIKALNELQKKEE